MVAMIQALGLEVVQARSVHEAVQLAERQRWDALVIDMHIALSTLVRCIAMLRSSPLVPSDLPILVASADDTLSTIRTIRAAGADTVLSKPFGVRELCSALGNGLQSVTERAGCGSRAKCDPRSCPAELENGLRAGEPARRSACLHRLGHQAREARKGAAFAPLRRSA
ncbi:MAG: response regulator [Alphaproteobacteria bacterium]|nr:response regulator [Alphaproteobacteria bacterium]